MERNDYTSGAAAPAGTRTGGTSDLAAMYGGRTPDADMGEVLRALQELGGKPIEQLDAKEARKQPTPADAVKKVLKQRGESAEPQAVGDVDDRTIAGPAGEIDIRIYKPASAVEDRLLPVIFYIHGGGWVIADLDVYDASPRALATDAHAIVVSTHYRQAPEDRFPAAHEDTYAAYRWTIEHARELGGDPSRIAVVGESAGGNMALALCYNAKREGVPLPVHQVLVYPVADYGMDTESYREMTQAKPLNSAMMAWFFDNYLNNAGEGESPAISPVDADLAGLPPATVISAELDPLRSEGETLAQRLQAAGVQTQQRTFDGVTHEFFGMAPAVAKAKEAQQFAGAALRRAFGEV